MSMSDIAIHSIYAMVDLFLDFAEEEFYQESNVDIIHQFVIDCLNLKEDSSESQLLQGKFLEELENRANLVDLSKEETIAMMQKTLQHLGIEEFPQVIQSAIDEAF